MDGKCDVCGESAAFLVQDGVWHVVPVDHPHGGPREGKLLLDEGQYIEEDPIRIAYLCREHKQAWSRGYVQITGEYKARGICEDVETQDA